MCKLGVFYNFICKNKGLPFPISHSLGMHAGLPPLNRNHAVILVIMAISGPAWALLAGYWPWDQPYYLAGRDLLLLAGILLGLLRTHYGLVPASKRAAWVPKALLWITPLTLWLLYGFFNGQGPLMSRIAGLRQWLIPWATMWLGWLWAPAIGHKQNTVTPSHKNHPYNVRELVFVTNWIVGISAIIFALTLVPVLDWCKVYFEAKDMPFVNGVPQQWIEPVGAGLFRAAGPWLDPISNGHFAVWLWLACWSASQELSSTHHEKKLRRQIRWGCWASGILLVLTICKGAWLQWLMIVGLIGWLRWSRTAWLRFSWGKYARAACYLGLLLPLLLPLPVRWLAPYHPGIDIHFHGWQHAMEHATWTGYGIGSYGNVATLMSGIQGDLQTNPVADSAWGSLLAQSGAIGLGLWLLTWLGMALWLSPRFPWLGLLIYSQIVISMFSENTINPMAMLAMGLAVGSAWRNPSKGHSSSTILDYVGRKAGMDYFSLRMHRELRNLGVENTLYTNFSESSDTSVRHVFPWEAGPRSRWSSTLGYVTGILRTFQGIRRQKSQHFIFHYFKGGLREALVLGLARWHGQCIHLLVHDVESLDTARLSNGLGGAMAKILRRWILHHACDHAYTFSQAAADELLQHEPALRERLTVLHHGHFLDLPRPTPSREQAMQELQIEEDTVTLLFFGQIKASKGLEILLQAMESVQDPRLRLIIAGQSRDFDLEGALAQWTSPETRSRIRLMNRYIRDEERDSLFKACTAVVLPYHRIYNSGVLMMALSYGKLVIASDLPANREILEHPGLGLLFATGQSSALARTLMQILEHTEWNLQIQHIQPKLLERFSWSGVAQGIAKNMQRVS